MTDSPYKLLARSRLSSLWLASDHLLLVQSAIYEETYKRFYFRDIQAITVRRTSLQAIWNAVSIVPLAICLIGLMFSAFPTHSRVDTTALVAWSIFVVLFAIPVVLNNILGTGSAVYLRTAVQTDRLRALNRLRRSERILAEIRPLITAAQGQLTADEVSARMQDAVQDGVAAQNHSPPPQSPPPAVEPPVIS